MRPVAKGLQALLADVFLVGFEIDKYLWRIARNAQRGAGHQKSQNQQKPPGAVDRIKADSRKHISPERAKLIDVIGNRLVLLQHGANDRRDADHREQGN